MRTSALVSLEYVLKVLAKLDVRMIVHRLRPQFLHVSPLICLLAFLQMFVLCIQLFW